LLLCCDHASHHVPPALGQLGLPPEELTRHIGWDIGAAAVAQGLSRRLKATAVLSGVSRLVIDCNRPLGHPTSICAESDGTLVPGNQALSAEDRAGRAAWYHPYHAALAGQLDRLEQAGGVAALIAIHSFTPHMGGNARPWHVGVLWNRDPRLAVPLIEALRRRGDLVVGDNEPYSGRLANHTVDTHGGAQGRPHVSIEIRQDLLAAAAGIGRWVALLAELLPPILARPELASRAEPFK